MDGKIRMKAARTSNHPKYRRSPLVTHNISIDGHRTSTRLEPVVWDQLQNIARQKQITVHGLVSEIDYRRTSSNLSSAIRAYVVSYLSRALRRAEDHRSHSEPHGDHQITPAKSEPLNSTI